MNVFNLSEEEFRNLNSIDFSKMDLPIDSLIGNPKKSSETQNRKRTNSINKALNQKYNWLDEENIMLPHKEWNNLLKDNNSYPPCESLKNERRKFLNRHSARESSKKKRKYISNLLKYVEKLESENQHLREENLKLQLKYYSH